MALEIRMVDRNVEVPLRRFFEALQEHGEDRFFHPHPFTPEEAHVRAAYDGKDLYYVLIDADEIYGYGMLRGWDEGYEVPSLGIVIHPKKQGRGLGKMMMDFLRLAAWGRSAERIRLRVHHENHTAVRLYQTLGYKLDPEKDGVYWVGFLELNRA